MKNFILNQPKKTQSNIAKNMKFIILNFHNIASITLSCAYKGDNISTVVGRLVDHLAHSNKLPELRDPREYRSLYVACTFFVIKYITFELSTGINFTTSETFTVRKVIGRPTKPIKATVSSFTNSPSYTVKGNKTVIVTHSKSIQDYMKLTSKFNTVRCKEYYDETSHYMNLRIYKDCVNSKIVDSKYQLIRKYKNLYNDTPFGQSFDKTSKLSTSGRDFRNYLKGFYVPYGDTFQKRLTEFTNVYKVTVKDVFYAKKCLLEELYGKMEQSTVESLWNSQNVTSSIESLQDENTLSKSEVSKFLIDLPHDTTNIITPKQYGSNLYLIELYNLTQSLGKYSRTMIRLDFVNSGGIHLANSTRDLKAMSIANLGGGNRKDSHNTILASYSKATGDNSKTRNDIKKLISTPYFHGVSVDSLKKSLQATESEVEATLTEITGKAWNLPSRIADWGTEIFMKRNTVIQWTLPDGFVASASAYSTASRIAVFTGSDRDKDLVYIEAQLPLLVTDNQVLRSSIRATTLNSDGAVTVKGGKVSVRSLLAVCVHSLDSYLLRQVYVKLNAKGIKMDSVLDEIGIRGEHVEVMYETIYDTLDSMQPLLQSIINKIAKDNDIAPLDIGLQYNKITRGFNIMSA